MDYKTFKNEVSNYMSYKQSLLKLNEEYEDIVYEMTGVKGVRYDKTPMSFNAELSMEMRRKLSRKLSEKELEIDHTLFAIKNIERNLNKLPSEIKDMCIKLFIENMTCSQVGDIYGYTHSGIRQKVKREVEKLWKVIN